MYNQIKKYGGMVMELKVVRVRRENISGELLLHGVTAGGLNIYVTQEEERKLGRTKSEKEEDKVRIQRDLMIQGKITESITAKTRIWENGIEKKWCTGWFEFLPLEEFHKDNKQKLPGKVGKGSQSKDYKHKVKVYDKWVKDNSRNRNIQPVRNENTIVQPVRNENSHNTNQTQNDLGNWTRNLSTEELTLLIASLTEKAKRGIQ